MYFSQETTVVIDGKPQAGTVIAAVGECCPSPSETAATEPTTGHTSCMDQPALAAIHHQQQQQRPFNGL